MCATMFTCIQTCFTVCRLRLEISVLMKHGSVLCYSNTLWSNNYNSMLLYGFFRQKLCYILLQRYGRTIIIWWSRLASVTENVSAYWIWFGITLCYLVLAIQVIPFWILKCRQHCLDVFFHLLFPLAGLQKHVNYRVICMTMAHGRPCICLDCY